MSPRDRRRTPHVPQPRNRGFWGWVERQILLLKADPERRARAFRFAWFVSTAVVMLGVVLIFVSLLAEGAGAAATAAADAPADGAGLADLDVTLRQATGADLEAWTVHERLVPAPDADAAGAVRLWLPASARNLVLAAEPPDASLRYVLLGDGLALVAWDDAPPRSVLAQFTLLAPGGANPDFVVPAPTANLTLTVVPAPGHAPPPPPGTAIDAEWEPVATPDGADAWRLVASDVPAGARVALAVAAPRPPGAPDVALTVVAVSAVTFAAGAAWSARRTPRLAPGQHAHLLDHLRELQGRLVVIVVPFALLNVLFFTVGFVRRTLEVPGLGALALPVPVASVGESIAATAFRLVAHQFVPAGVELIVTRPIDAALTQLLVSLFLATLAILPLAAWELAAFLGPGLHPKEKNFFRRAIPVVVALFLLGAAFAYYVMVPVTVRVLYGYATALDATPLLAVNDLVSFAVVLTLIFGLAFELPVVMVGLARLGVVTASGFAKYWRHAIVGIFVLAGIVTPDPTVVSMVLLAVPLTALYLLGLVAARAAERRPTEA